MIKFTAPEDRVITFVLYQYEDDSAEEARTRVLADLSGGNGPDLMYVSLED